MFFVVSNIVSIVTSPSKKEDQNEFHAIKDLLQCSMSSAFILKKCFYKTWTFSSSSPQYRGGMVYQIMYCLNKKVSKALKQKLVEWIMKNSNVRESPIACDILLVPDAENRVKWRVPKLLL